MAEGNEKQADQKKGAPTESPGARYRRLIAEAKAAGQKKGRGLPSQARESVDAEIASLAQAAEVAPLNPENLALRGEPTARTLIANLLLAMDDKLPCLQLVEVFAAARAYLSTRAPAEEAERDAWQRDRLQVLMLQEQAVKDRDAARLENTRLVAEVDRLKANIAKAEIAAEGCWLDAKDAGPWYASERWRCRHGHTSVVACLLAAVKGCHGNNLAIDGTSDKRAIRQPEVATRAPAGDALIGELRGALLYAVEFCERETNTIRRAVPRLNAGWRASIKDADAAAKRGRTALALPVEGRAPRTLIVGAPDSPHEKLIREGRAPDASHEKKLGKIKKLVIDRSRWLRGEGGAKSALLRPADKKMCCLGFLGETCGIPSRYMLDIGEPAAVETDAKSPWPPWLEGSVHRLIETNDAENLTDDVREMGIAVEFAANGVEVEFIDGVPGAPP